MTAILQNTAAGESRYKKATSLWSSRDSVKKNLREALSDFAAGRNRCMYCGDNEGTDIDHYRPLALEPLLAYTWLNHLLACSRCNSHHKRERFPCDDEGLPLLLDPTVDEPADHLLLALSTGRYVHLTARGEVTVEVCGLNRDLLTRGRQCAYDTMTMLLPQWLHIVQQTAGVDNFLASASPEEGPPALVSAEKTIKGQPFADVLHAMARQADQPGADVIFSDRVDILEILRSPLFRVRFGFTA
ncbi:MULTISPECIES: HNH endonuclease [Actinosynnema]|uniref:HNH endonuclease n=1 Tax=Actinosynnema TaxID=40566 RepID=UPI0020A38874|nr:HNH endonuclease [Actinosynnema pretiosum]